MPLHEVYRRRPGHATLDQLGDQRRLRFGWRQAGCGACNAWASEGRGLADKPDRPVSPVDQCGVTVVAAERFKEADSFELLEGGLQLLLDLPGIGVAAA